MLAMQCVHLLASKVDMVPLENYLSFKMFIMFWVSGTFLNEVNSKNVGRKEA